MRSISLFVSLVCLGLVINAVQAGPKKGGFEPVTDSDGFNVHLNAFASGDSVYGIYKSEVVRLDGLKLEPIPRPKDVAPNRHPAHLATMGGRALIRFSSDAQLYVLIAGKLLPLEVDQKPFGRNEQRLVYASDSTLPFCVDHGDNSAGLYELDGAVVTRTAFPKEIFLPGIVSVEGRPLLYSGGGMWFFEDGKFIPVTAAKGEKLRIPAIATIQCAAGLALINDVTGRWRAYRFDGEELLQLSVELGDRDPKGVWNIDGTAILLANKKLWALDGEELKPYEGLEGVSFTPHDLVGLGEFGVLQGETDKGHVFFRLSRTGPTPITCSIPDFELKMGDWFRTEPIACGRTIVMPTGYGCLFVDEKGKASRPERYVQDVSSLTGSARGVYAKSEGTTFYCEIP